MAIPVSLEDAKRQLRQGGETLDAERLADVEGFIADAAAWVERYTGHILEAREVKETFRSFDAAELRAWPISPTAVPDVAYTDAEGVPIALVGARVDTSRRPARIVPLSRFHSSEQLVTVTIRAGYEPDDVVPGNIRRAMLVLIAAYDADRAGGEIFQTAEKTARALCSDYRLRRL